MRREARRAERGPDERAAADEAASPASFQPLNAHTSAGARRPSGRLSQISGCIRITVHHGPVPSTDSAASAQAPARPAGRSRRCATGDDVDGVFACTRKDRLVARTGTPYLALELRDRTGAIPARAFRDADVLAGALRARRPRARRRPRRALPRRAAGRADERSRASGRGTADPAAFLPVAYRDLDELDGFLEHLAGEVRDPGSGALLDAAARRRRRCAPRCAAGPCTRAGHHAYLGGLLEHTVAVATLARRACALHQRLNQDLLLTAAIVHDLGRTREFTYGAEIGLSDEGRLLGHVELGLRMLERARRARPRRARAGWRSRTACSATTGRRGARAALRARRRRSRSIG